MTAKIFSRNELLQRGAERYLDALAAIEAFDRQVQDTCKDVYQRHAAELATQMGLDEADSEPYADNDPEERWAAVGVSRPAQKNCEFYLYLSWEEIGDGNPRIEGHVYLEAYYKDLRDALYERFRQKNPRCRVVKDETYGLMLTTLIQPNEVAAAGQVLDDLVLEWLGYCKSAGGLGLKKQKTP